MLYIRMCFDKQGSGELRDRLRKTHREYIASFLEHRNGVQVVQGGPICVGDDVSQNLGSVLVIEADSLLAASRFNNDDPFTKAGLFEHVHVVRWDRHIGNPGGEEYEP